MNKYWAIIVVVMLTCACKRVDAQDDIPIGTWRLHLSFTKIISVALGETNVYAATPNGVLVFDKADQHFDVYNRLTGLTFAGISVIAYDNPTQQLIVAFNNGTFDVIKGNQIINIDPSINAVIPGSRKINGITIHNGMAYLASDYGVLLFDLNRSQIKETWRDLGEGGTTLPIHDSAFTPDSVFLATDAGIMRGKLSDNLLDFNKWKRFNTGVFNTSVETIEYFNNKIYTAINGSGIYRYDNSSWTLLSDIQALDYTIIRGYDDFLYVAEQNNLWRISTTETVSKVETGSTTLLWDIGADSQNRLWLGDDRHGLITNVSGQFLSISPSGPSSDILRKLEYNNGKIFALPGGYDASFQPLANAGQISVFEDGQWRNEQIEVSNPTSMDFSADEKTFISSFGGGVVERSATESKVWNETNSTLVNTDPSEPSVFVTDMAMTTDGLWVTNYGASSSLHLYSSAGEWQSFAFPSTPSRFPAVMMADYFGSLWMTIDPQHGGGMFFFDKEANQYKYLNDQVGNGFLPDKVVHSLALDRDGLVWAGTDQGVAYFYNANADAVRPIFENRFLLQNDKVKALAVDGGNRKWMGTERGVWLFNITGEELVANFTTQNSPLPSNDVLSISVNAQNGEVFFATMEGLVSFRADATEGSYSFNSIKIFPNPVNREFNGLVGITGLATDAIVKITDVSGKLVWQSQASGGTTSWNVQDYSGRRVNTGVFLVYAVKQDGSESIVGKIAVIN